MDAFICTACGTQFPPSDTAPQQCVICEDERQFVPPRGQTWTTLPALAAGHLNAYREHEPGLIGIGTQPSFAIGQRALLIRTHAETCSGTASPCWTRRPSHLSTRSAG